MTYQFSLFPSVRNRLSSAIIAVAVASSLLLPAGRAQAQSRILFVGNSFTHGYVAPVQNYNVAALTDENAGLPTGHPRNESDGTGPWGGVPGIFKKFADQAGLAYEVHIEAINGVGLDYHFDNALSVIEAAGWDRVVLQELSTRPLPASRGGQPAVFFDYATRLEQTVHAVNPAAKIYLYETWARADLTYPANQPYSGLPIEAMGADLHDAYYLALAQNSGLEAVAPVGDAWLRAIRAGVATRNPYAPTPGQFDLWASYFHASKWGSYLSACVLFGQITGVDPRTLGAAEQAAADLGIAPVAAAALQQVAYEQVRLVTVPPAQYVLTVTTAGGGTVSKNPNQVAYASGSTVTLTAIPAAGFAFGSWSGDATGPANPLAVRITSNTSIVATFVPVVLPPGPGAQQVRSYTLVNADTNTDIQTLPTGATLNLATLPTRNLNVRANTTPATVGSVGLVLSGAQSQNQTESNPPYALFGDARGVYNPWTPAPGAYSLLATPYTAGGGGGTAGTPLSIRFTVIDQVTVGPFALTTSVVGSGTVSKNPNQATYASGSTVSLTAAPAAGFVFSGWSGDATGPANPLPVTMSSNKTVTATFAVAPAQYTLTLTTSGSGTVSKNPNQATYASGSTVSLTAAPAAGFVFSGWSGGATGPANPLPVTMTANKSITATFTASSGGPTFYQAVNINGGTIILDGQSWTASSQTTNFQVAGRTFSNQNVPLSPATDASRTSMIRSSVFGTSVTATFSSLPAGTYAVYLYVWEDNGAETFDISVQGQVVLRNYNSGTAGHWDRLGPFAAAVAGNSLTIGTVGGYANLSGIEIWRHNPAFVASPTTVSGIVMSQVALAGSRAAVAAEGPPGLSNATGVAWAYPNPAPDGRFLVRLPEAFRGEVSYTLLSALGGRLAAGTLNLAPVASTLNFDFSHEITSAGLYYLLLRNHEKRAKIRLLRP